jgi:aminopeptidase
LSSYREQVLGRYERKGNLAVAAQAGEWVAELQPAAAQPPAHTIRRVDPRDAAYARLLVDCIRPEPGWQVLVRSQPLARPLVEEVTRELARRGVRALVRLRFESVGGPFLREAPLELLGDLPPIERNELESADSYVAIVAPENTRNGSDVPAERIGLHMQTLRRYSEPFLSDRKPWVGCYYPTQAAAQDAGMSLPAFAELVYGAVLVDWESLRREMERIAERFDRARSVRVVGEGTDLTFSLEGREGKIDAMGANMPGGEVFYSPVEDSAEGVISYSEYPACYLGHEVAGVRLRFEGGTVVEASATRDEAFLLDTLDTDEGARRLGEFGIGCNPGIQRHVKNTLFDEKMAGTVHLAVGTGFPQLGGENVSAVHWDMVKELRNGGRIELDGETVQESGQWRL